LSGIEISGTASPLVSHPKAIAVGMNPHPIKSSVTSHKALMIPTVDRFWTAGWFGATVTGPSGKMIGQPSWIPDPEIEAAFGSGLVLPAAVDPVIKTAATQPVISTSAVVIALFHLIIRELL
jgi:hypothetical protein